MALAAPTHVLVVAGSDSSGSAGIARDIETICALGQRACVAVTAVTAQTHASAGTVEPMPAALVAEQIDAAFRSNDIGAVKIGMLASAEIVASVSCALKGHAERRHALPIVLDPVLASSSGRRLLDLDALHVLKTQLMPLCTLVTPNWIELAALSGEPIAAGAAEAVPQAQMILSCGCEAVLVKAGHAPTSRCADILVTRGRPPTHFDACRLDVEMRGTGCMLSSAITAWLASGTSLEESVRKARSHVHRALRHAAGNVG